jgi:hypothetical protein
MYRKLIAQEEDRDTGAELAKPTATVQDLLTEFLAWTEIHRESGTLQHYQKYLADKDGFADLGVTRIPLRRNVVI